MTDDGFEAFWLCVSSRRPFRALRPSTQLKYQSVARKMYDCLRRAHVSPQTSSRSHVISTLLAEGVLSLGQMRVAQAILNKHWLAASPGEGGGVSTCDWMKPVLPEPVPTWRSFVPRKVLHSPEFDHLAPCIERFVAMCRPEPRAANNIRYHVAVLFSVMTLAGPEAWQQWTRDDVLRGVTLHTRQNSQTGRTVVAVANRLLRILGQEEGGQQIGWRDVTQDATRRIATTTLSATGFTADDVCRLKSVSASSVTDHLIITLLSQTGLRRRAIAWLRLDSVFDPSQRVIRTIGAAREKSMHVRHFPIGAELRECILRYIQKHERRCVIWLFPSPRDIHRHIAPCTVQRIVKRLCRKARLTRALGTRGFRKYVVRSLVDAGNSMEYISKWLGHRRVVTTFRHYWDVQGVQAILPHTTECLSGTDARQR